MKRTRLLAAILTLALTMVPLSTAQAENKQPTPDVSPRPTAQADTSAASPSASPGVTDPNAGAADSGTRYILMQLTNPKAVTNGDKLKLQNSSGQPLSPYYYGGIAMIPLRAVTELFGYTVAWESAAQKISVTSKNTALRFAVNSAVAELNSQPLYLNAPVLDINGTVFVPARDLCLALGCYVHFYAKDSGEFLLMSDYPVSAGDQSGTKNEDFQNGNADSALLDFKALGDKYLGPSQSMYVAQSLFLQNRTTHVIIGGQDLPIVTPGASMISPFTAPDGNFYIPLDYCARCFGLPVLTTDDGTLSVKTGYGTAVFPLVNGYFLLNGEKKENQSYATLKFDNVIYTTMQTFAAAFGLYGAMLDGDTSVLSRCDFNTYDDLKISNTAEATALNALPSIRGFLALTFDDGPSGSITSRLLDGLRSRNVHVTFFLCNYRIVQNLGLMPRYRSEGHEVGNHSATHPDLTKLSLGAIDSEIDSTSYSIEKYTGAAPHLFRPPGGAYSSRILSELGSRSLSCILWSVDPKDWYYQNTQKDINNVLSSAGDGDIVLMHDMYNASVDAGLAVIDTMQASGYKFLTVSDLAFIKGYTMSPGTAYRSFR